MLAKLGLKNIQCHRDLLINLDKITVFTGSTDSGKTSILRGLQYALLNNNSGDAITTNGESMCEVSLTCDNHTITRGWSKSKNYYALDDKEFTAFRTDVPAQISNLFNISEVNVQNRRDLPFMVYFKASECAEQFSQMLDLSEINNAIQTSNKRLKDAETEISALNSRKREIEKQLLEYTGLGYAFADFESLVEMDAECTNVKSALDIANSLYICGVEAQKSYDNCAKVPQSIHDELDVLFTLYNDCKSAYNTCNEVNMWIDNEVYALQSESALRLSVTAIEDITEVYKLNNVVQANETMISKYEVDIKNEQCCQSTTIKCLDVMKTAEQELHDNFPDICPLCGGTNHAV